MQKIPLALLLLMICFSLAVADGMPAGKIREPGTSAPAVSSQSPFIMGRDPFTLPTEILPTDCLPSMPLCRFDYSQLKVVGVIQAGEGQLKALVEDPDGRGYSVSAGQMIGNGTVIQVAQDGLYIRVHHPVREVRLPLFEMEKGT